MVPPGFLLLFFFSFISLSPVFIGFLPDPKRIDQRETERRAPSAHAPLATREEPSAGSMERADFSRLAAGGAEVHCNHGPLDRLRTKEARMVRMLIPRAMTERS